MHSFDFLFLLQDLQLTIFREIFGFFGTSPKSNGSRPLIVLHNQHLLSSRLRSASRPVQPTIRTSRNAGRFPTTGGLHSAATMGTSTSWLPRPAGSYANLSSPTTPFICLCNSTSNTSSIKFSRSTGCKSPFGMFCLKLSYF